MFLAWRPSPTINSSHQSSTSPTLLPKNPLLARYSIRLLSHKGILQVLHHNWFDYFQSRTQIVYFVLKFESLLSKLEVNRWKVSLGQSKMRFAYSIGSNWYSILPMHHFDGYNQLRSFRHQDQNHSSPDYIVSIEHSPEKTRYFTRVSRRFTVYFDSISNVDCTSSANIIPAEIDNFQCFITTYTQSIVIMKINGGKRENLLINVPNAFPHSSPKQLWLKLSSRSVLLC